MPHIIIKCFPGRTEEQKKKCAESVALAIMMKSKKKIGLLMYGIRK